MEEKALTKREEVIFQIFDNLDDEAIVKELKGAISESWVYSFQQENKEIIGLSKVGVDQATILLTKQGNIIRENKVVCTIDPTDPNYMLFTASVVQYAVSKEGKEYMLKKKIGVKRQCTKMKLKDGSIVEDPFWYEKGAMKALRNATMRLIDEELKQKIIALAKEQKKVYYVKEEVMTQEKKPEVISPQLKRFWGTFKVLFNYEKKEEINSYIHDILYKNFQKDSLKSDGIDYGKLLVLLIKDERMKPFLRHTKGGSDDSK